MNYMALFYTHSGAIKYDRFIKSNGYPCELMPVPRKLSSNCGIGAKFSFDGNIKDIVSEDIEKIFTVENKNYKLIFEND
ncbi:DUF3343 domain-containing protein [Haloimpatiens sp. FM7330]|uniref:DUF3343 domain-containing protein n=1 Tax=Haloimpatiens sp. FM7330 TaxID=3298610 RepID=UPI00362720BC